MSEKINPIILKNLFGIGVMENTYYIGEKAYSFSSALKASLILEDSAFIKKGEKRFVHLVLAADMQPILFHTKFVYFGIQITTKDNIKNCGYLYLDCVQINTLLFYEREKEAKKLVDWINSIIQNREFN